MKSMIFRFIAVSLLFTALFPATIGRTQPETINVMHYFGGNLGRQGIKSIFNDFSAATGISVIDIPVGHESFKNRVLELAAKGFLPDIISYWAGARSQFLVDSGVIQPLDELWEQYDLSRIVPASLSGNAAVYNKKHYLVPFGYHCVGFFYNPSIFTKSGITKVPETWNQMLEICEILSGKGIKPFALGAKERWPAQFWFDYMLLRSAGADYRQKLMNGGAAYTDPQVNQVMAMWKRLIDQGYFLDGSSTEGWTEAADRVTEGRAAMTLMGTWITGYWKTKGKLPLKNYDFFEFPVMDPAIEKAVIGPVDGFMISKNSKRKDKASQLLAYLLTDKNAQSAWAASQGALSPNLGIDPSIYDPVMQKALKAVSSSKVFAFNYDLATTPPMAEKGLTLFFHFLKEPARYPEFLKNTQVVADEIFKE